MSNVIGNSSTATPAVQGTATIGSGVLGVSSSGSGVMGQSSNTTGGAAVLGIAEAPGGVGVGGVASNKDGVFGNSNSGNGVHGTSVTGAGVSGQSTSGYGVYGTSTTNNAGQFEGNVGVTGTVTASDVIITGQDCAEDFDISKGGQAAPGTVVVFDNEGTISQCRQPYDKRVAGVVSGAGSYRPGVILGRVGPSSGGKAPVALMGRVYCKVDASYSAIEVGDMLTTSLTAGFAMKASNPAMAHGTVIGKALGSMREGQGLIPILVALQ